MNFFEILFLVLVLLGVLAVASTVKELMRGHRRTAWMTVRVYLVVVAIYAAALLATTLAMPLRIIPLNESQYSDDWSISVVSIRRLPHDLDEDYELDFRLANRGTTVLAGPRDLTVYLLTEDGRRYDASDSSSTPAFDAPVKPGKYVSTTRKFVMPTNLNRVELVVARRGFRLGWFILGRTPFDGHTVVSVF